jgi:hypothetical protein
VPERNPDTAPDPAAPPPYEPVTEPEETPYEPRPLRGDPGEWETYGDREEGDDSI